MPPLGAQVLVVVSQKDPVAQFPSTVQAAGRQVIPSWQATPPGQAPVVAVPGLQVPEPSQLDGVVVSWPPAQAEVPGQVVPTAARAQAPFPSQKPVAPHAELLGVQSLSALLPFGSGAQMPSIPPVLLATQDSQVPVQSLLQQTWSALEQTPLAHWPVVVQAAPGTSFGLHVCVPGSQIDPAPHPASPPQPPSTEPWASGCPPAGRSLAPASATRPSLVPPSLVPPGIGMQAPSEQISGAVQTGAEGRRSWRSR